MAEIREPRKANSIEKKRKIIASGLKLFEQKGYYNTNTAEIAKEAGVSTGIVYSYFKDKKDIFLQSLVLYLDELYNPIMSGLSKISGIDNYDVFFRRLIMKNIEIHKTTNASHENIEAMAHLDEDVHHFFMEAVDNIVDGIRDELIRLGVNKPNMEERTHIAYDIIESFTHQIVDDGYDDVNYDVLLDETVGVLIYLFK